MSEASTPVPRSEVDHYTPYGHATPRSEVNRSALGHITPRSEVNPQKLGQITPRSEVNQSALGHVTPRSEVNTPKLGHITPRSEVNPSELGHITPNKSEKVLKSILRKTPKLENAPTPILGTTPRPDNLENVSTPVFQHATYGNAITPILRNTPKPAEKVHVTPPPSSIVFSKCHANGNDLLIVNNTSGEYDELLTAPEIIRCMCDRKLGIGGDGVVEIRKANLYFIQIAFYMANGLLETSFEGNAARVTLLYLSMRNIIPKEIYFQHGDGSHYSFFDANHQTAMVGYGSLPDPQLLTIDEFSFTSGSTGSLHHIIFLPDIETLAQYDVTKAGQVISESEDYKGTTGININFVAVDDAPRISVRTYDRGVSGEVMCSGTGAVAAVLAHEIRSRKLHQESGAVWVKRGKPDRCLTVTCLYGEVEVRFRHDDRADSFKNVFLSGPVWSVIDDGEFPIITQPEVDETMQPEEKKYDTITPGVTTQESDGDALNKKTEKQKKKTKKKKKKKEE